MDIITQLMLQGLCIFIAKFNIMHPFDWEPVPHWYVKDEYLRNELHTTGYVIKQLFEPAEIAQLKELYQATHKFVNDEGGMFYSVYSQDLAYRQRVHNEIGTLVKPKLDQLMADYKVMLNSFIVKASGPKSEFYVHQDTTGLDEFKYSQLIVWMPLEDITESNGAMCVIPRSQYIFSPYRSISFPPPYQEVQSALRKYFIPLYLKAGEVVIFDNRIVHYSMPNLSGVERVVAISGVFPAEAKLITCFKEPAEPSKIELIEHEDDFILTNPNFLVDCTLRPATGKTIDIVTDKYPMMNEEQLETAFAAAGIKPVNLISELGVEECKLIAEPITE